MSSFIILLIVMTMLGLELWPFLIYAKSIASICCCFFSFFSISRLYKIIKICIIFIHIEADSKYDLNVSFLNTLFLANIKK